MYMDAAELFDNNLPLNIINFKNITTLRLAHGGNIILMKYLYPFRREIFDESHYKNDLKTKTINNRGALMFTYIM